MERGGRPTKYRDGLANEIEAYLEYGLSPHAILDGLGTNMGELKRWANKKGMIEAFEQMQEAMQENAKQELVTINDDDDYDTQLNHGVIEAIRTLRLTMRAGTSDSAKVAAANSILDRKYGKAVQAIEHKASGTFAINVLTSPLTNTIEYNQDDIIEHN